MVGIVSYGSYIPIYRIKIEEIAKIWGEDSDKIKKSLGVYSKSVPSPDEDAATIAVEAVRNALRRRNLNPQEIGAVLVGSESHPYVVKPTSTIVAEAIGCTPRVMAADHEFACKAGTAAMQHIIGLVKAGIIRYGVAVGADTSQGAPGDALEYTASAGGTAFIIGKDNVIAEITHTLSYCTDTPDFWRREKQEFPQHGGRFTGEPAYFRHVVEASKMLMSEVGTKPQDYKYAVFHQPNAKFPLQVAKKLGFKEEQLKPGLIVPWIGNTYSGCMMTGLSAVLDVAEPGDRIIAVSFGSGAGSDAFDIVVTDEIEKIDRKAAPTVKEMIDRCVYIDYATYAKFRRKIIFSEEV